MHLCIFKKSVEHVIGSHFSSHAHILVQASNRWQDCTRTPADSVQLCLLGSNFVLTWRETKYYSQANKQIIVTSLTGGWLCLSHVQMEFEENKLAARCCMGWMHLCVCFMYMFACSSVCRYTCLSLQQLPVYLLVYYISLCFCVVAHVSKLHVFRCSKEIKTHIKASVHSPPQVVFQCQTLPWST